jgi:hypothetical protein
VRRNRRRTSRAATVAQAAPASTPGCHRARAARNQPAPAMALEGKVDAAGSEAECLSKGMVSLTGRGLMIGCS